MWQPCNFFFKEKRGTVTVSGYRPWPYHRRHAATFTLPRKELPRPFLRKCVMAFPDDLSVTSSSWQEHLQCLDDVLTILREQSNFCKGKKCRFGARVVQVNFLRHTVNRLFSHNVVTMETSAIGWPPWLITFWYLWISEQLYMLMHWALTRFFSDPEVSKWNQSRWPSNCTGFHGHHVMRNSSIVPLFLETDQSICLEKIPISDVCGHEGSAGQADYRIDKLFPPTHQQLRFHASTIKKWQCSALRFSWLQAAQIVFLWGGGWLFPFKCVSRCLFGIEHFNNFLNAFSSWCLFHIGCPKDVGSVEPSHLLWFARFERESVHQSFNWSLW